MHISWPIVAGRLTVYSWGATWRLRAGWIAVYWHEHGACRISETGGVRDITLRGLLRGMKPKERTDS